MSTGYQIYNQENTNYLTFQVVDWINIFLPARYVENAEDWLCSSARNYLRMEHLFVIDVKDLWWKLMFKLKIWRHCDAGWSVRRAGTKIYEAFLVNSTQKIRYTIKLDRSLKSSFPIDL